MLLFQFVAWYRTIVPCFSTHCKYTQIFLFVILCFKISLFFLPSNCININVKIVKY